VIEAYRDSLNDQRDVDRYPFVDPLKFGKELWPHVTFTRQQRDIIYSTVGNDETVVVAANMMGKDFVSAFVILHFFMTRTPVRVVTTSADYSQLEAVLWGELRRFIQTSRIPLEHTKGGPLIVNHMHLRKLIRPDDNLPVTYGDMSRYDKPVNNKPMKKGWRDRVRLSPTQQVCGLSYCIGRVAAKGEGMLGHHIADTGDGIPRTLAVFDEASGVTNESFERASTWAYECSNYFRQAVKEGDRVAK
jgi:hypothetical protein